MNMMKKTFISIVAATLLFGATNADASPNVLDLKNSITDPAIVYPESFEADTQKLLESWFIQNYTASDDRYATEPDAEVSDEEIKKRLAALPTLIEMPFNQIVRSYIDKYTKKSRPQVEAILGLSLYYMPIFEQALEEQGLPLELKYLPVIESGLDPNAVSKHGAAGLWQFMLATAKGLGMEVNSLIDERRDPYLSSELAASYLKGLHDTYGDWSLAIAAYNCGPGTVNKAIRRAGGEAKDHDFWSIYPYLPEETRGYVPMFIAANYVMTYYPEHNISPVLPVKPLVMDTIHVKERLHFDQICNVLDIPIEEMRILNPQFRADIIPGSQEVAYNLILPSQQIHAYLMSEDIIRNYEVEKYAQRETVDPGQAPADTLLAVEDTEIWVESPVESSPGKNDNEKKKTLVVHKVVAGETLSSIADKYEVTIDDIKKSNNLRRNAVRVGQQLRISTALPQAGNENLAIAPKPASQPSSTAKASTKETKKSTQANKPAAPTSHKVKSGENLSVIAKKYGTTVAAIKNANGMTSDNLKIGQVLKLPTKGSSSTTKKSTSTAKKKSTGTKKATTKKKKR